jgi:hypothetical protein
MEYIRDDSTLPVPYNLVPTLKSFYYIVRFFYRLCCRPPDEPEPRPHPGRVKDVEMYATAGYRNRSVRSTKSSE